MVTTATRTLQRAQRREELLDAADRVVRRGDADIAMDEVAAEAGITKPVLYRHFGDKDGLCAALAARYVEELADALEPAVEGLRARDRLAASIDAYLTYIEREPERYRFLLTAAERAPTAAVVADFRSRHVANCAFAAGRNLRRAGIDDAFAELWAQSVSGMVRSVGIWWLETRGVSRERLLEYLTAFLWEGFAAAGRGREG